MADETNGLNPRAQALEGELLSRFALDQADRAVGKKSAREQAIIDELAKLTAETQRRIGALTVHASDVGKGVNEHLQRNLEGLEGEDQELISAFNTALLAVLVDKQVKGLASAADVLMRRALGADLTPYEKQGFLQTLLGDGHGH